MKTLILINIVSSNTVYKLNAYVDKYGKDLGEVLVLFCGETERNRKWVLHEKINFKYKILKNRRIEIGRLDLFTYFLNFSAWSEFDTFCPDRVIVSGWDQFAYQLAYIWAFLNKKKITLWSGSTVNEMTWRRFVTLPLVTLMVRMSERYIAYGTRAKHYLISLGADSRKIAIFQNDVNGNYFKSESLRYRKKRGAVKKSLGISARYNFIYVGQFINRKNVLGLLESFNIFKNANPDWGLVIVGYGNQEPIIKNFIRKENISGVRILGNIEQYNLPKIYTASDCLILPSLEEVWGLVVNEALYCGLKVIVSDKCGCAPDLVIEGKNGYVFKAGNREDLIRKMEHIALSMRPNPSKPYFSIVTCTLNSGKYVSANIKSVRSQTFESYEQIFIDGHSSDNTLSRIYKYKGDMPKRVKLYFKTPRGISNAMNEGIKHAEGLYTIFLHSDDSFAGKSVLHDAHDYIVENNYPDWIFGRIRVIEGNGNFVGIFPLRSIYNLFPRWFLKFYSLVPHQGVFIKKSVFDKFGVFDEKLTSSMDLDLWMRIWNKTRWLFWKETVSNYMIRGGAQSSGFVRKSENDKNAFLVRRRYLNQFEMEVYKVLKSSIDHFVKNKNLR